MMRTKELFRKTGRVAARFFLCLGTLLIGGFALLMGALTVVFYGPAPTVRDLLVCTLMETSGAKFVARIYFSDERIEEILAANAPRALQNISTGDGVNTNKNNTDLDLSAITVEEVNGPTFHGKMMIVNDPSRIFVESVQEFGEDKDGETITSMVERTGAVAAINGGGFYDPGGYGRGGMPWGVVIKNGQLVWYSAKGEFRDSIIIGFDQDHKLQFGKMTPEEALDRGIQEGLSFRPALIMDGKRVPLSGTGGGLNPRTAIGQRKDGAVLMLVVDGRQPDSIGASFKDLQDVMLTYGAVNAANLDGGSSSTLVYKGEILNNISMIGLRKISTAFLVR